LCKNINTHVILLGGKEDETTGNEIAKQSGSHVVNLSGKLSLHQSALVVKLAQKRNYPRYGINAYCCCI